MSEGKQPELTIEIRNKISDDIWDMCSGEKLNAEIINKLLEKYNIDINFGDSEILAHSGAFMRYDDIRLLLSLGANPKNITEKDIQDMEPIDKIRLDAIFKSYGYDCNWEFVDFNKYRKFLNDAYYESH